MSSSSANNMADTSSPPQSRNSVVDNMLEDLERDSSMLIKEKNDENPTEHSLAETAVLTTTLPEGSIQNLRQRRHSSTMTSGSAVYESGNNLDQGESTMNPQRRHSSTVTSGPIVYENVNDNLDQGESSTMNALEVGETVSPHEEDPNGKDSEAPEEGRLTEDIYSLIYTSNRRSPALRFCIFVVLFQDVVIALILWDLLDDSIDGYNPLNVPPGVSTQVRVAEAFALFLAVATQGDVVESMVMLHNGYDARVLERNPSATRIKWFLSVLFQFIAGGGLLTSNFILVMQSSTVINMMLNFAALTFVSEIDNVAFQLAKKGFVSDDVQREAKSVVDLRVPLRPFANLTRRISFLMVFGCLMIAYGFVVYAQLHGAFICDSIRLQLGDEYVSLAPAFSGIYDRTDHLIGERFTYVARHGNSSTMLAYCESERAWTFSVEDEGVCDWTAISQRTETFDVTKTSDTTWQIWIEDRSQALPFQKFYLQCNDCEGSTAKGRCSGHGECENNECICEEGRFGSQCEFTAPCDELVVDARTKDFPKEFAEEVVSNQYSLLRDESGNVVTTYGKSVYAHQNSEEWSVMFFTGRRWVVTSTFLIGPLNQTGVNVTQSEIVAWVRSFHAFFTEDYLAIFISDPMDFGAPSDAFTPSGLGWFRVKTNSQSQFFVNAIDTTQPLGTVLLCSICDRLENNCFNANRCLPDGSCNCTDGFEGALCELDTRSKENRQ